MNTLFSAVIPAAGSSVRMGTDKAMLLNANGLYFASHLLEVFQAYGCSPVVLVVNEKFDTSPFTSSSLVKVINHHPEKGRSWSIRLGLQQLPPGNACFIQNIDNPHLQSDLLDMLAAPLSPRGYCVPVYKGRGGHPVLLGQEVVEDLRVQPGLTDFRRELLRFSRIEVPCSDDRILWNINTPDDYTAFTRPNR